ncbi:DUF4044 domain-containing protein, partial [Pediococcus acidilactici]
MYNNKKKKKSGLQKVIMVFVWIMIILTPVSYTHL